LPQALSFYKLFGYPTGLGALLVRRSAMPLLAGKLYFGGGTVAVSCADADVYRCCTGQVMRLLCIAVQKQRLRMDCSIGLVSNRQIVAIKSTVKPSNHHRQINHYIAKSSPSHQPSYRKGVSQGLKVNAAAGQQAVL